MVQIWLKSLNIYSKNQYKFVELKIEIDLEAGFPYPICYHFCNDNLTTLNNF